MIHSPHIRIKFGRTGGTMAGTIVHPRRIMIPPNLDFIGQVCRLGNVPSLTYGYGVEGTPAVMKRPLADPWIKSTVRLAEMQTGVFYISADLGNGSNFVTVAAISPQSQLCLKTCEVQSLSLVLTVWFP